MNSATPEHAVMHSETYLDIVWRQFKKNRLAYYALGVLGPLFLVAVFAPLIASDQPLLVRDGSELLFPWTCALLNPAEPVDYLFNLALVGFFPWLLTGALSNRFMKRRNVPGLRRLGIVAMTYVGIIVLLYVSFALPGVRPTNKYRSRTFTEEIFQSGEKLQAVFVLVPFGPTEQDLDSTFKPPLYRKDRSRWNDSNDGFLHLLGTDNTGRDVFVQMVYGTRISMTVGFVAVGITIAIGVVVGALAGYFGGRTDMLISRIIEVVLLFPSFFLILTLVALIGPSIYMIMIVIGITGWPTIARLIRGEVLRQRGLDYVAAARALGSSNMRIIFRHILPNAVSPALVAAPFGIAGAIITEAGLSLLGFGVRPPTPSWGTLLRLGSDNYTYWWLVVAPSSAIFLAVTAFNLVGGGLRDAMDPRLRV